MSAIIRIPGMGIATVLPTAWDPTQIPGLAVWFKPEGPFWQDSPGTVPAVADGDPVGRWSDVGGAGLHLTQITPGKRPLLKIAAANGRNVVRGDGVDDLLVTTSFTLQQPLTVALAARCSSGVNSYYADSLAQNSRAVNRSAAGALRMFAGSIFDSTVPDQSALFACVAVFNGASSVCNFNGVETSGAVGALNGGGLTLFAAGGAPVAWLAGDIGEFIAYNRALSGSERSTLQLYLKNRWGTL